MVKIDKMSLFGEFNRPSSLKRVWWRKFRTGTLLVLDNQNTQDSIATFIVDSRPVRLDNPDGLGTCYDIVKDIEKLH